MLSVESTKGVALFLMLVVTLSSSLLPLYVRKFLISLHRQDIAQLALSGCLCFGGGVLLAIVFLHLLPETNEGLQTAMAEGFMTTMSYPVAEVIVCSGFFFIYLLEEIVYMWIGRQPKQIMAGGESQSQLGTGIQFTANEKKRTSRDSILTANNIVYSHGTFNQEGPPLGVHNLTPRNSVARNSLKRNRSSSSLSLSLDAEKQTGAAENSVALLRTVLVVVALSFHSVMEGLALGLATTVTDVWILFSALCAHKIFISFSMAMELLEVGVKILPFIVSMIIFSIASPLGGVLGMLVVSLSEGQSAAGILVPTILQGISGGTIMYVTFCEVMERERAKEDGRMVHLVAMMLGFALLCGIEAIGGNDHSHNVSTDSPTFLPATLTPIGLS